MKHLLPSPTPLLHFQTGSGAQSSTCELIQDIHTLKKLPRVIPGRDRLCMSQSDPPDPLIRNPVPPPPHPTPPQGRPLNLLHYYYNFKQVRKNRRRQEGNPALPMLRGKHYLYRGLRTWRKGKPSGDSPQNSHPPPPPPR